MEDDSGTQGGSELDENGGPCCLEIGQFVQYVILRKAMETHLAFDDQSEMEKVCGINDSNLPYLEVLSGCEFSTRGNVLYIQGDEERVDLVDALFDRLRHLAGSRESISEAEIFMEYQSLKGGGGEPVSWTEPQTATIMVHNRLVYPKSAQQETYIRAMQRCQIVFATGPAGTGKTFLAVSHALSLLLSGKRQKLVLTRPVVEAGESLGFLPGDLSQKINPYLRPLYDAMEALLSPSAVHKLEENGSIEIAPLAYMRGRSLQNAVVILDEAQNTTKEQMQMFLTRIGENATAIITGDVSQIDLPRGKESGLVHAVRILDGIDGIAIIPFSSRDVVRGRIVQKIIDAYAQDRKRN
jgi:phosphate starvation-inducible PhoH-like protein